MERAKHLYIALAFTLYMFAALANDEKQIYKAFISNDMNAWKTTMDNMSKNKNKTNEQILQLINFQYGYIAWSIGNNKKQEAEYYIGLAETNIAVLEKQNYKLSDLYAYKSAIYGFKIGLNLLKAPFLGPRSIENAQKALQYDTNNWFAYIQNANIYFYMPSIFENNKQKAVEYYEKALQLMEKSNVSKQYNWNYLNLMVTLAQAYKEVNNTEKAKQCIKKILQIEPNFLWVKNELYFEF
ncbi:MAG: hypothetical protein SNJ71_02565 [Bacteroidales bacterium]